MIDYTQLFCGEGGFLRAEGSASLGVAVQLGDDHGRNVYLVLEGLGLGLAGLPDGGVHHVHNVVRLLWGRTGRQGAFILPLIVGIYTPPFKSLGVIQTNRRQLSAVLT